jgi:hypothetical protein
MLSAAKVHRGDTGGSLDCHSKHYCECECECVSRHLRVRAMHRLLPPLSTHSYCLGRMTHSEFAAIENIVQVKAGCKEPYITPEVSSECRVRFVDVA